jgi:hypothetical protein
MVLASCGNKYYGTNFILAEPTSILIAPGLRIIQFLFFLEINLYNCLRLSHALGITQIAWRRVFTVCAKLKKRIEMMKQGFVYSFSFSVGINFPYSSSISLQVSQRAKKEASSQGTHIQDT